MRGDGGSVVRWDWIVGVVLVLLVGVPALPGGIRGVVLAFTILEDLVHVPNGVIAGAGPDIGRIRRDWRLHRVGRTVHGDRRSRGERRHGNPDERLAGRVPGIDVEGKRFVVPVGEPEAAGSRTFRIGEAVQRGRGDAHEYREVLKFRRGCAGEREFALVFRERRKCARRAQHDRGCDQKATISAPPGKLVVSRNYHSLLLLRIWEYSTTIRPKSIPP